MVDHVEAKHDSDGLALNLPLEGRSKFASAAMQTLGGGWVVQAVEPPSRNSSPSLPLGSTNFDLPSRGRLRLAFTRDQIVAVARGWIGTPYRHQGALKGIGCDCLGLLLGVWRELQPSRSALRLDEDLAIPPYTPDWAEAMKRETFAEGLRLRLEEIAVEEADAGDVLLFRWRPHLPAKHAGILTAPDRMVHAQERASVAEVALSGWWRRRVAYAFSLRERDSVSA